MGTLIRWLSAALFVSALMAVVMLLIFDALNHLRMTSFHRQAGALAFILIGLSCLGIQILSTRPFGEILKEFLLAVAFLLWGFEQFLPPTRWVTLMDSMVVLIFVVDLSLIIFQRLRQSCRKRDYL